MNLSEIKQAIKEQYNMSNPDQNKELLNTKVQNLLSAIDHNVELMRTYSNPQQDLPAISLQYIGEELEIVRSHINNAD